ncbi:MAG: hypothetical protein RQ875_04550, partial [Vicingaceae bacterium]|nr:hypothetical protein [Vicingaceae bacterium]
MTAIYQPPQTCISTGNNVNLPIWSSTSTPNYGILFTGIDCPARIGLGTNNPNATLDVRGTGYFTSFFGINSIPTNQYQLHVNNSVGTTAGIYLNTNHPQNWPNVKYGFQNVVNNSNTIAYSVTDATTNQDVFVVMGDGSINVRSDISQNNKSFFVTNIVNNEDVFRVMGDGTVGVNLLQSSLTKWCLMDKIVAKLGVKEEGDSCSNC